MNEIGSSGSVKVLSLESLGQRYRRYRLADPEAEEAMAGSLRRWGQLSPVVALVQEGQEGRWELLDGFKRWSAARQCGLSHLSVRVLEMEERTATAAILRLNWGQGPVRELEEAWIVQALVRDSGMSQMEVAHLLGQHKSWVCRRLALVEKPSEGAKEDLRLGLLNLTLARQLTRLPAGNQEAVMTAVRRDSLMSQETSRIIDLLMLANDEQAQQILAKPREAIRRADSPGVPTGLRDPRLSRAGNWLARHLSQALQSLLRVENWLQTPNERELHANDREILLPVLLRVGDQANVVVELIYGPDMRGER